MLNLWFLYVSICTPLESHCSPLCGRFIFSFSLLANKTKQKNLLEQWNKKKYNLLSILVILVKGKTHGFHNGVTLWYNNRRVNDWKISFYFSNSTLYRVLDKDGQHYWNLYFIVWKWFMAFENIFQKKHGCKTSDGYRRVRDTLSTFFYKFLSDLNIRFSYSQRN